VIWIGVLHFVVRTRGESKKISWYALPANADGFVIRARQRAVVVAHMKGMCMFETGMRRIDPRLQMLDPNLMIASLGIIERREIFRRPQRGAQPFRDQLDRRLI